MTEFASPIRARSGGGPREPVPTSVRAVLTVLAVMIVTNAAAVVGARTPLRLYVLTVVVAAVVTGVALARGRLRLGWLPVLSAGLLFVGVRSVSVLVADDVVAATALLVAEAQQLIVLVLLVVLLLTTSAVRYVAGLAVASLAALAALGVLQETVVGNSVDFWGFAGVLSADLGGATARHHGSLSDPNFWGRLLVLFLPLGLSMAASSVRRPRRAGWALAVLLLTSGVYLSQSRGAFLGLAVAVLVWLLAAGGHYRRYLRLTPLVALGLLVAPGVLSRLATLRSLGGEAEVVDGSVLERAAVQRVGLAMVADNPLLGVGVGNFEAAQGQYARDFGIELGSTAPHNTYLQLAAETGLVGLAAYLLLILAGLSSALAVVRQQRPCRPPSAEGLLAAGLLAGIVAWLVTSLFLHLTELDSLLLVLTMAGVLRRNVGPCRVLEVTDSEARETPLRCRVGRTWAGVAVVTGLVLSLLAALRGGEEEGWSARQPLVLQPADGLDGELRAYAQHLLSRPYLLPTLERVVESTAQESARADVRVVRTATGSPVSLELVSLGVTRQEAQQRLEVARDRARASLESATEVYRLVPGPVETVAVDAASARQVVLGVAVVVAGIGTLMALDVRRGRATGAPGTRPSRSREARRGAVGGRGSGADAQ